MSPKKKIKTIEEMTQEVVEGVAKEHQVKLQKILVEYHNVFLDELPKGPPPKWEVVYSIEVQRGSESYVPELHTSYVLRSRMSLKSKFAIF